MSASVLQIIEVPEKFKFLIYANLIVCAIVLGLLCHFVSILPEQASEKTTIVALALVTYVLIAASSISSWRIIAGSLVQPGQKAKAFLLAALPKYQPGNTSAASRTLDELSAELAEHLENLSQGQRAIVNYSSELICSLNEEGKILNLNMSAEKKWLHPNMSLIGASLAELAEASDKARFADHLHSLVQSKSEKETIECRMVDLNGKPIDFRWKIEWSPTSRRFYCIGLDITPEKEIERLRAEITSMVSHDLRAPVSSLAYFIDGLLSGDFGELNELGKTQLTKLRSSLDQILRLIEQLLNAEQLEAGSLKVDTKIVPASSIIETSVSLLEGSAQAKNVKIEVQETDELVFADFDRCVQIMNNLISNAIKFSPDSSIIKLNCKQENAFVKFEVSDKGPGIAPEFWSVIFDRFKTLSSSDSEKHGAGLGLYISKKLVELQEGQMGLFSSPPNGTSFWFTLKRASEADLPGYLD